VVLATGPAHVSDEPADDPAALDVGVEGAVGIHRQIGGAANGSPVTRSTNRSPEATPPD
jgi:hypothetical protein